MHCLVSQNLQHKKITSNVIRQCQTRFHDSQREVNVRQAIDLTGPAAGDLLQRHRHQQELMEQEEEEKKYL